MGELTSSVPTIICKQIFCLKINIQHNQYCIHCNTMIPNPGDLDNGNPWLIPGHLKTVQHNMSFAFGNTSSALFSFILLLFIFHVTSLTWHRVGFLTWDKLVRSTVANWLSLQEKNPDMLSILDDTKSSDLTGNLYYNHRTLMWYLLSQG